jgi:hypothetical protein
MMKSFVICSQVLKYHSGEQIWDTEIGGACGLYRENRNACRVTGGTTEGNRSLVIYRPKWEGSMKHVMRNRMEAPGLF